ncbi:dimethyl sulfoxide reductase anchor subunit family protein [Luteimonas sp. RIT-PG2_3]
MHPALSVILFTTLSGAGFGLLCWSGLAMLWLALRGDAMRGLQALPPWALGIGATLAVIGLLSSLAHLGKPQRAWRALSQWRTSWLSREGVLAIATLVVATGLFALLVLPAMDAGIGVAPARAIAVGIGAVVLAALALATVASTAMIYASLKPIPAWTQPLVVPVYLLFALLTGLGLLAVLAALLRPHAMTGHLLAVALAVLALMLAALKARYWQAISAPLPGSRGAAVGLPERKVEVFERPHTQDSFVTREMVFVVARRHARRLRIASVLLFAGLPLLACGLDLLWPAQPAAWLALATLGALAGAFVERWLFFAEARHVVSLYY